MTEGRVTRSELRAFAMVVATGFLVLGGVAYYRTRGQPDHVGAWVCWAVAAVLVLLGLVVPQSLRVFHRVWTALGHALGWANTRILLGVIFFVMLTPTGWLVRVFRRDALKTTRDSDQTHWIPRIPPEPARERYRRMF